MRSLNNAVQSCPNPGIVASRLISIRNIYLRQELETISNQIQEQYNERLPALSLVSIAAYEQVFQRQPLSLPDELRREAVKYGLKYYQLNIEKLRMAEAQNGLCLNHDRLSCYDKKCPLHQSNLVVSKHKVSEEASRDETQSTLSDSTHSLSSPSSSLDSTITDTSSISPSTSSTNEHSRSSTSTFPDTPSDVSSYSPSTSTSNQLSPSTRKHLPGQPPKIVVSRASNDTKSTSSVIDDDERTSARKRSKNVHRRSSKKRKNKHVIRS